MTVTLRLALFDLDNTLLTGDSDVLWCRHAARKCHARGRVNA